MNNWSLCPSLEGRIDDVHIVEYSDDQLLVVLDTWNTLKPFAVVMYAYGATEEWLDQTAERIETEYPEIAALWVHPAAPRYIGNHRTPNPGMPILILQNKSDLVAEKARLRDLGYYQAWK